MQTRDAETRRKWDIRGKSAIVPALIGILIISFVALTRGEYGVWILWIGVPLVMASLGYMALVNAIPIMLSFADDDWNKEEEEKPKSE